jgi:hypothetical protein
MAGNESAIILQILELVKGTSVGDLTNKVLVTFGGLASVTIIYFILMVYYQHKVNQKLKEQRSDIDTLIILVNEQNKKMDKIHKVLIPEDTQSMINEQDSKKNH